MLIGGIICTYLLKMYPAIGFWFLIIHNLKLCICISFLDRIYFILLPKILV